jgi:hypothetical protein
MAIPRMIAVMVASRGVMTMAKVKDGIRPDPQPKHEHNQNVQPADFGPSLDDGRARTAVDPSPSDAELGVLLIKRSNVCRLGHRGCAAWRDGLGPDTFLFIVAARQHVDVRVFVLEETVRLCRRERAHIGDEP